MAVSIYMKITNPTIDGGQTIKGNEHSFEILSLVYSAVAVSGHVSYSPVTVTLNAYNGPALIALLGDPKIHSTVALTIDKPNVNGILTVFETITISGAVVTLFQESVSKGAAEPILELSIDGHEFAYKQNGVGNTFTR